MSEIQIFQSVTGEAVTSSYNIAVVFSKPHNQVMRSIRKIVNNLDQKDRCIFAHISEPDQYGRLQPAYALTKEAFLLLAMGFGGKKALQFKIAYINAFNHLETKSQVQAKHLRTLQTYWLNHHPSHEAILSLCNSGYSISKIAVMLSISESTVSRRKKSLANIGLLPKPKNFPAVGRCTEPNIQPAVGRSTEPNIQPRAKNGQFLPHNKA